MPHSEIIEKYLTRVILFKEKQDLYSDFADESKRFFLLRRLFEDLDFDDALWELRSESAKQAFKIYKLLDSDYELGHVAPTTYNALLEKYLRRAIALDPYNTEYLKAYFNGSVGRVKRDKNLAVHYISLYHPNSSEFQNLLVDLNLKPNEVVFDCLSETVTVPFVNEMVFLKQKSEQENREIQSQKKLEELAKSAGLNSQMIEQIKKTLPEMLTSVQKTLSNHWLDWPGAYKAVLAMEKAIDLAPFSKDVLLTALPFYSGFYWRLILGYKEPKGNSGKDQLMEYVFGSKKPKQKEIFDKANEIFSKAKELKDRLFLVLLKEGEEKQDKKKNDTFSHGFLDSFPKDFGFRNRQWLGFDEPDKLNTDAYFCKETLVFQILTDHFSSKKNNLKIILFSGIPVAIICYLFGWWLFKTPVPFFPVFIPAFVIPAGIIYLREKIWQNKKMDLDEVLDWSPPVY